MMKQASVNQMWALGDLFRNYFSLAPDFRLQVKTIPAVRFRSLDCMTVEETD